MNPALSLSGLLLALPAVSALLIVNLAFGVMTRAAPQLNIFSLGFPVSMVFGLAVIWASLAGFLPKYDGLAREAGFEEVQVYERHHGAQYTWKGLDATDEVVGPDFTELWISIDPNVDYDETIQKVQTVVDG